MYEVVFEQTVVAFLNWRGRPAQPETGCDELKRERLYAAPSVVCNDSPENVFPHIFVLHGQGGVQERRNGFQVLGCSKCTSLKPWAVNAWSWRLETVETMPRTSHASMHGTHQQKLRIARDRVRCRCCLLRSRSQVLQGKQAEVALNIVKSHLTYQ